MSIERITTGFLTGNLFEHLHGQRALDAAERFAGILGERIKATYPDAVVEVRYEEGSGEVPKELETRAYGGSPDEREAAIQHVNGLIENIYTMHDWHAEQQQAT